MFKTKKENHNLAFIIISSYIVFYTLYIWKDLIIPFVISILISFALIWLSNFYQKLKVPNFISMTLSIVSYFSVFWLLWLIIDYNIDTKDLIDNKLPDYQNQIWVIIKSFFEITHIPEPKNINEILQKINMAEIFNSIISWITSIFWNAWMIFFYTLFIILEFRYFWDKLILMVSDQDKRNNITEIIWKIKNDTKAYFIIKTIVSFITSILSYLIMASFWLDLAILWALLIFLLNYIPNIWSVIALFFPILIALIQKDISLISFAFISWWLVWIQIFMWNIVEPKFMWNKLNLSPLAIILSLSFWWALWWVIWMLLSVPIMVIINIILSKIPETRSIAIMLSEKWELRIETEEEVNETRKKILHKIKDKIL